MGRELSKADEHLMAIARVYGEPSDVDLPPDLKAAVEYGKRLLAEEAPTIWDGEAMKRVCDGVSPGNARVMIGNNILTAIQYALSLINCDNLSRDEVITRYHDTIARLLLPTTHGR